MDTVCKLNGVSVTYDARVLLGRHDVPKVVDDATLEIFQGETLGIVGRNGCGKSTLLRVLSGVMAPYEGSIWMRPGLTVALLSLGLGFKSQLSGRDNAILAAMLQGATKSEALGALDRIEAFSELGEYFYLPVKTYSSGMRARLGFSTGIITEVDLLLIDEVLAVGDAGFREKAEAAVTGRMLGNQTVVFVSHSATQVRRLCERVVWMDQGRIVEVGDSGEVTKRYISWLQGQDRG